MTTVYLALGSNEGNRQEYIDKAIHYLRELPGVHILKSSTVREYPALEQATGQNPFLNSVLSMSTDFLPLDLLHKLQVIERRLGRQSKGDQAPRTIDLDILSFGDDLIIQGKTLVLPHPRIHERIFVLEPLAEINPQWIHPRFKKSAQLLLEELKAQSQCAPSS